MMANKETHSSGAPIQPSSKGAKAEPQVNSDVELGNLANGNVAEPDMDIMQIARTGDIPAMGKMFESKEYDATYSDDEGITALHVCHPLLLHVQTSYNAKSLPLC